MELASIDQASIDHSPIARPPARCARTAVSAAHSLEVAAQLRAAIMEGDDARIARLLSDLLRVRGLTKGQRVRLQSRALLNLVHTLRSAALNDELTGLPNRRGFVQSATRLLDLTLRDGHTAHFVYFRLDLNAPGGEAGTLDGSVCARDVLLRRTGNFLRDLFPAYGVYEVLGRLSAGEFAALTPVAAHASRGAILLRARNPENGCQAPALPVQVAVAQIEPTRPMTIDELLHDPPRIAESREPFFEVASTGSAPRPDLTLA